MADVSVIIAFIDEYDLLTEAIYSAMAQQGVELELIIVRNHHDAADVTKLPPLPPNAKILHQPIRGSAYARNTGLQAATHTWVQFLDVDDLLMPEKLSHQVKVHGADVIVSPPLFQTHSGKQKTTKWYVDDIWVNLLNSNLGSTSSMLWKRAVLNDIGGWNTAIESHQEYELLFRVLLKGYQVVPLDRSDTIVRERKSGSITVSSQPVRALEGIRLRESIWRYLNDHGMQTDRREQAFLQYVFRQLRGLYRRDKTQAMALFHTYFDKIKFNPSETGIPGYQAIYKMLGFSRTERLIYAIVRMRNKISQ
jgi:glycosyltransferase involved in cell wall biosynthesis